MIQRVLASKGLVAYILACATGITLYFRWPFPENDMMLHLISIRSPLIYAGFKYTYTLFLFTTPYIGYSLVLSGLYVFAFRPNRKIKPMLLPAYPEPRKRNDLFLVLGEVHDPRTPAAAEHPYWLAIPERGLFTGIAIFGAIGTGKTSGCMYPYAAKGEWAQFWAQSVLSSRFSCSGSRQCLRFALNKRKIIRRECVKLKHDRVDFRPVVTYLSLQSCAFMPALHFAQCLV